MQTRGLAVDTAPQAKVQALPAPSPSPAPAPVQVPLALPTAQPMVQTTTKANTTTPQRKIFITAEVLQKRLATNDGPGRSVELAYNEFLTPAAMDLVDQRRLTVRKQPKQLAGPAKAATATAPAAASSASATTRGASKGRTLGLVISKPNAMVQGVLDGLERDGILALDFNQTNCWIENTQMLCNAIISGSVTGGVVMVPLAADAVMLANKIRGIRAVQGVKPEGLVAAMGRLAPNVLAMEHSSSTFHEIRTMLRAFAVGSTSTGRADAVMDAIEKLERA